MTTTYRTEETTMSQHDEMTEREGTLFDRACDALAHARFTQETSASDWTAINAAYSVATSRTLQFAAEAKMTTADAMALIAESI